MDSVENRAGMTGERLFYVEHAFNALFHVELQSGDPLHDFRLDSST